MKLHVGCGHQYLPGYINLEYSREFKGFSAKIDMLGSGMELPFRENSLDEIISFHVIEHMPRPQKINDKQNKWRKNVDDFLRECYRTLKYGGKIIAECPDTERLIKMLIEKNDWGMLDHIYGLDRYPGDTHQWGYTSKSLAELFKKNGFDNIRISEGSDYHSIDEPSLRVEATKIGLKRINIEPTSICNLACTICSRDEKKRSNSNMDFNLFRSIIYQLFNLGLHEIEIRFFLSGEPLVAGENLIHMINYATRLGFYNTLIHTNGTLLNKFGEGILKAGLGAISISFDGPDKETYEKIRVNSKFERVVEHVKIFLNNAKEYSTKTIIQTIVPAGTNKENVEIKMRELLPGADDYYIRYPHNWNTFNTILGAVNRTEKVTECFPSEFLSIYADGTVPICCADLNGDYILADANKESLMYIWINKLGLVRDRMKKGEPIPELCDNCERYNSKAKPDEEKYLSMVAEDLILAKKYSDAKDKILYLLSLNPCSVSGLNTLAILYLIDKDPYRAKYIFDQALSIEPNNKIVLQNISICKYYLGEEI